MPTSSLLLSEPTAATLLRPSPSSSNSGIFCPPTRIAVNYLYRRAVLLEAESDPVFQQQLMQLCAEDPMFFFDTFVWTEDAENVGVGPVPFVAWPKQRVVIRGMDAAIKDRVNFGLVKCRRAGASWIGAGRAARDLLFLPWSKIMMHSRTSDDVDKPGQPKSLLWKVDFILSLLPSWMWQGYGLRDRTDLNIRNPRIGSVIEGSTTQKDMGRGGGYTWIWGDEGASIREMEEALDSILSATGCYIPVSTPRGASGGFYEAYHGCQRQETMPWYEFPPQTRGLYRASQDGVQLLDNYRFTKDYPFIRDSRLRSLYFDKKWIECRGNTRRIAQEMECKFLGSGWDYFDHMAINEFVEKTALPPLWEGELIYDDVTCRPLRLVARSGGPLRLWIKPMGDGLLDRVGRFVMGSDISAGNGSSDSVNVVLAIEDENRRKVGEYARSDMGPERFARLSIAMTYLFAGVDSSCLHGWDLLGGTGQAYGNEVMAKGSRKVFMWRNEKKIDRPMTGTIGVHLGADFKPMVMGAYREALYAGRFIDSSLPSLRQHDNFEEDPNGLINFRRIPGSLSHGDIVIANAIAYWSSRDTKEPAEREIAAAAGGTSMGQRISDRMSAERKKLNW